MGCKRHFPIFATSTTLLKWYYRTFTDPWRKGFFFSILLHGVILGLLLRWQASLPPPQESAALALNLITAKLYGIPVRRHDQAPRSFAKNPPWPPKGGDKAEISKSVVSAGGFLAKGESGELQNRAPLAYGSFDLLLNQKLEENKIYPRLAQQLNQTGFAKLSFWLDKTGEILSPTLEASTGVAILDEAALKTVLAINPVTEAKTHLSQKTQFVVNIRFIVE